jgi:hypothetical protein
MWDRREAVVHGMAESDYGDHRGLIVMFVRLCINSCCADGLEAQ